MKSNSTLAPIKILSTLRKCKGLRFNMLQIVEKFSLFAHKRISIGIYKFNKKIVFIDSEIYKKKTLKRNAFWQVSLLQKFEL